MYCRDCIILRTGGTVFSTKHNGLSDNDSFRCAATYLSGGAAGVIQALGEEANQHFSPSTALRMITRFESVPAIQVEHHSPT